ncbi:MAG: 6-phosphogluconolactonase [Burkholderiales bacterium]|nr:6-phosphogluconolactonase [Burkholderiales bacterium]
MGDPQQIRRWHAYATPDTLIEAAAADIMQNADAAVGKTGSFRIVLAGGNTPKALYRKLRHMNAKWDAWEIYFGDERCLPPDHPERNSSMALDAWLSHVPIPMSRIHVIPAELGPEAGASSYARILKDAGKFDLVLLGLGEDGHTASLFPGKKWGDRDAFPVFDAPKPPSERISMSASRLGFADGVFFLVSGESKRQAVTDWRSGKPIPASGIIPSSGIDIFIESFLIE